MLCDRLSNGDDCEWPEVKVPSSFFSNSESFWHELRLYK